MDMWQKIGLQLKFTLEFSYLDLDSSIFTLNNLLSTKLKYKKDTWLKIENPIKN